MAAVSVVLPWSMWPMVPTLTCGLVRSNFFLPMAFSVPLLLVLLAGSHLSSGGPAHDRALATISSARPEGSCW